MDDRVRAEYEKILTAAIIKNGQLVRTNGGYYGWGDYEGDYGGDFRSPRHSTTCGIAKTGRVEEDAYWYEFMGTFYEGDNTKHGMEVHGVSCNCGRITDRVFRWSESPGEAIRIVLEGVLTERVENSD
jgi:hypothetical protein